MYNVKKQTLQQNTIFMLFNMKNIKSHKITLKNTLQVYVLCV